MMMTPIIINLLEFLKLLVCLLFFVVSVEMVNLGGVSLGCTFLETEDAAKLYQQVVERYESGTSVYCGRLEKIVQSDIYFLIKICSQDLFQWGVLVGDFFCL